MSRQHIQHCGLADILVKWIWGALSGSMWVSLDLGPVKVACLLAGYLSESCPAWPHLGCSQAPSPTCSARWVGPWGGRRGLPATSPHSDSGAGPGGFWGLGQVNHHGRSQWGVGCCFAVGCVCLCLSACVFGASLQAGPLPSTPIYTMYSLFKATGLSLQPSS